MSEASFRVGDRIAFRLGVRDVDGIVKEDRGPIGIRGRHLYTVEFHRDFDDVALVDLPAEMMSIVSNSVAAK